MVSNVEFHNYGRRPSDAHRDFRAFFNRDKYNPNAKWYDFINPYEWLGFYTGTAKWLQPGYVESSYDPLGIPRLEYHEPKKLWFVKLFRTAGIWGFDMLTFSLFSKYVAWVEPDRNGKSFGDKALQSSSNLLQTTQKACTTTNNVVTKISEIVPMILELVKALTRLMEVAFPFVKYGAIFFACVTSLYLGQQCISMPS